MKNFLFFLSLLTALLAAGIPVFADEELLWSNFNHEPVKNIPAHYPVFTRDKNSSPVLITRIRTYHWNDGNGAQPGQICIREGNTKQELQCWQAVGRSAYGVPNVYWEVLTDFIMEPGRSYGFRASDFDSWSNNAGSDYFGMIELYGENPAPAGYTAPAPASGNMAVPSNLSIGQTFTMGRYEQDNNPGNGKEPIEWQVLTVQNDRALVISKYALDFREYNDTITDITWENCTLRRWLNGDFYNSSFSEGEKQQILLVTNENPDNPMFGTNGGNRTQDRIFVLSSDEAQRYFSSDASRICQVTDYAAANYESAYSAITEYYLHRSDSFTEAFWWLRTPGDSPLKTVHVTRDGSIYFNGYGAMILINGTAYNDVRPALWIKTADPAPTAAPKPRTCFKVTYAGNNCLAGVPIDNKCYELGDLVTILFEPVEYMNGLIFSGWDMDDDGNADFGYNYPTFAMPNRDVTLKAVCYRQYQDHYNNQYYGVTTGEVDPQQYYNPYHDPTLNQDIYDPGTGWWYSPDYYYGVG